MKTELSVEDICVLKKIARRVRFQFGYLKLLNAFAYACGYKSWTDLTSESDISLAS